MASEQSTRQLSLSVSRQQHAPDTAYLCTLSDGVTYSSGWDKWIRTAVINNVMHHFVSLNVKVICIMISLILIVNEHIITSMSVLKVLAVYECQRENVSGILRCQAVSTYQ